MTPAASPKLLTPEQQQAAVDEWGGPNSFRCAICAVDSTDQQAPGSVPTVFGFELAICRHCTRRHKESAGFRRDTRVKVNDAALRTLAQRAADLAGVTGAAFVEALHPLPESLFDEVKQRAADESLHLAPGTFASAVRQAYGLGVRQ